jgi:hypothetical protein
VPVRRHPTSGIHRSRRSRAVVVFPGLASALSRAGFERKLQGGPHPFHVSKSQRFDRGGKQTGDFATLATPQHFWTALNPHHRLSGSIWICSFARGILAKRILTALNRLASGRIRIPAPEPPNGLFPSLS